MEPDDLMAAAEESGQPVLAVEDLVGRVDLWSAESDVPESFLAAGVTLGSGVLYTQVEVMTADEVEEIGEQLREGADGVTRSAVREAWALVDEAVSRAGATKSVTLAWSRDGLLHGVRVHASWWMPFAAGITDLAESIQAVLDSESDERVERLVAALREHSNFNVNARLGALARTLAPEGMTSNEITAAARTAKEQALDELPDEVSRMRVEGRTDAEIRVALGIGDKRLAGITAQLKRWQIPGGAGRPPD
jgi:hypothetical protein